MKTQEGIKYVYKGELLSADEYINALDEIIQDIKLENEQLKRENHDLLRKTTALYSDLKRNRISDG